MPVNERFLSDALSKILWLARIGKMSTKSVDLSSSFFQQFAVVFDLWQQGPGGWVTLLGASGGI